MNLRHLEWRKLKLPITNVSFLHTLQFLLFKSRLEIQGTRIILVISVWIIAFSIILPFFFLLMFYNLKSILFNTKAHPSCHFIYISYDCVSIMSLSHCIPSIHICRAECRLAICPINRVENFNRWNEPVFISMSNTPSQLSPVVSQ